MKTIEELEAEVAGWIRDETFAGRDKGESFYPVSERIAKRILEEAGPQLLEIRDEEERIAHEDCGEQLFSWDYFKQNQVDGYWMSCDLLGPHDEHENSHTGAKWKTTV